MWLEGKNLKSLIRFHSANKIDNYNRGVEGRKKKKSKGNYRISQNIRIINVFLESLLSGSFPSLGVTLPHLPRMPSTTVLVPGPAVGAAPILIWSSSCVFWPPVSTAIRTIAFVCVCELSMSFYIFHIHRVCLVDCVGLICSLYSWRESFGCSSLAALPLGFNCGFISTSACGSFTGVYSWGCLKGFGSAPMRARCRGGADA